MSNAELKSSLHKLIEDTSDPEKLKMTFNLLSQDNSEHDLWDTLSEEEKASIERGLKDIEEGRVTPHEEVMKQMKTRFPKIFK